MVATQRRQVQIIINFFIMIIVFWLLLVFQYTKSVESISFVRFSRVPRLLYSNKFFHAANRDVYLPVLEHSNPHKGFGTFEKQEQAAFATIPLCFYAFILSLANIF